MKVPLPKVFRRTPPDGTPPPQTWRVGTLTYTLGGLVAVFCWLLCGDFAWSVKERSIVPLVQLALKRFQASDLLAGILVGSLPQAIWIFFGPIISWRSDRHRGRWGRRLPYLLLTIPTAMFAMAGLAASPLLGQMLHPLLGRYAVSLETSTIVLIGGFWTVFELATVTGNTVLAGLINDVVPPALVGRFYGLFRALSLIVGMAFNYWLMGGVETHYTGILLGLGLVYGAAFTLMVAKVKEGEYPPPPAGRERVGFLTATRLFFRDCFSDGYYRWLYTGIAFSWMGMSAAVLFSLFFARGMGVSMGAYGKYIALAYLISLLLAYPLGLAADKFHPLRVGLVVLAINVASDLWAGFYATSAATLGVALVTQAVLNGVWLTVSASLPQRLLPREKFAQYNSAIEAVKNFGLMLVGPLLGLILDCSRHEYRYSYLAASLLMLAATACFLVVNSKFALLGGPGRYVAPE